jgi:photosystem II PsbW protein
MNGAAAEECKKKDEKRVVEDGLMKGMAMAMAMAGAGPAAALVDERLSTEGTGLSLGLSNPLLIWILLGVATLVWSLFFTYSSTLPEGDDDSGLAL